MTDALMVRKGKKMTPEQRAKKSWRSIQNDMSRFVRIDAGGRNPQLVLEGKVRKWLVALKAEGGNVNVANTAAFIGKIRDENNQSIRKRSGIGTDGAMSDNGRRIKRAEKLERKYKLAFGRFNDVMNEPGDAIVKVKLTYALRELNAVLKEFSELVNGA